MPSRVDLSWCRAHHRLAALVTLALGSPGCGPPLWMPAAEGSVCERPATCEAGLICVADVGAEYGHAGSANVCERPRAVYDFLHFGERGEDRRVDEALDMLGGSYRLPRMPSDAPELAVVPHELVLAGGVAADCSAAASPSTRVCRVPDWQRYVGDEIPKYSRFILFGLRMTAPLVYVYQHASDARLRARVEARTGFVPSGEQLAELRRAARDAGLALFDSFVARGHVPFALAALPECYQGGGGYLNPNASWSPALAFWDPATGLDGQQRLITSDDVPVDCADTQGKTYLELRDSLWDRHAAGYRAMALVGAFQLFRGLLAEPQRRAWVAAMRETGDALALPSSYEGGNNHGITQAVALMQLGHELARLDPELAPRASAEAWLDLGRHRASDFVEDTVFEDGTQVEQSPFYHNYQLGLMLYVARWLSTAGIDLAAGIDPRYAFAPQDIPPEQRRDFDSSERAPLERDVNRLEPNPGLDFDTVLDRMARGASHIVQPDGWIPMIGSSLPQRFRGYMKRAFEPYLARGHRAARELAYVWSGGETGEAPPSSDRLMSFDDSGFVTMHSGFALPLDAQTHVVFNTGMPYHRHSHADALAVHLYGQPGLGASGQGLPLLVDSGWYSYRDVGRHYFESTIAHNTVSVDGLNQCTKTPAGKRAAPRVDAPLDACASRMAAASGEPALASRVAPGAVARGLSAQGTSGGVDWLYQSAAHGLYEGVVHRRAVISIGPAVLVVVDRLASDEPRDYRQLWHITPEAAELPPALKPRGLTYHVFFDRRLDDARGGPLFSLHESLGATPASAALTYYGGAPVQGVPGLGWLSTAEGEMARHPVVEFRRSAATQATFGSVFLLGDLAAVSAEVSLFEDGSGLRAQIVLPGASLEIDLTHIGHGAGQNAARESVTVALQGALPAASGG